MIVIHFAKHGELFIKYMEDEKQSSSIFNICNILFNNTDKIVSGKRYRRKEHFTDLPF